MARKIQYARLKNPADYENQPMVPILRKLKDTELLERAKRLFDAKKVFTVRSTFSSTYYYRDPETKSEAEVKVSYSELIDVDSRSTFTFFDFMVELIDKLPFEYDEDGYRIYDKDKFEIPEIVHAVSAKKDAGNNPKVVKKKKEDK